MRFQGSVIKLISSCLLLLMAAMSTVATTIPVRSGSKYGESSDASFPNALDFYNACATNTFGGFQPCEALSPNTTTVLFNGTNYTVFSLAEGFGDHGGMVLNLIDLGSIGPNATFTLPPSFIPGLTEIFSCNDQLGDGLFSLQDSGNQPINAPCSPNVAANPGIVLNADGSFTTSANFSLFNLVLDSPVSAPEPASMLLLGVGLIGLWTGRKRLTA